MKKILITGANSYIGTSFAEYMKDFPGYQIDTVDMIDGSWRKKDFSGYDAVFHVAGIAHIKETPENAHLYDEVNRDLTVETAKKAKENGVKQFVFLSSMSVYGLVTGVISEATQPNPKSRYGRSKWEAEQALQSLCDGDFRVCVLRPPMVYGEGCRGNYQWLRKAALKLPVFPDLENKRSMIFIDTLSAFVKERIDEESTGVFFPQDEEYICTTRMVLDIAEKNGRNIRLTKVFNPILRRVPLPLFQKIFGDLIYEK